LEPELKPEDDLIQLHLKHYINENNFTKVAWYYDLPLISISEAGKLFIPIKNSKQLIAYYDLI